MYLIREIQDESKENLLNNRNNLKKLVLVKDSSNGTCVCVCVRVLVSHGNDEIATIWKLEKTRCSTAQKK